MWCSHPRGLWNEDLRNGLANDGLVIQAMKRNSTSEDDLGPLVGFELHQDEIPIVSIACRQRELASSTSLSAIPRTCGQQRSSQLRPVENGKTSSGQAALNFISLLAATVLGS